MKTDPAEIAKLARLAESRGGKVLHMSIPGVGSVPVAVDRFGDALSPIPAPRPSKYRNVRSEYAGLMYDSKLEAEYAAILNLEKAICSGMWWVRQVVFRLGCPENLYRVDFLAYSPGAPMPIRAVDVKGVRTAKFERDVKLWRAYGPCPLVVVTRKRRNWIEEVVEGRNP